MTSKVLESLVEYNKSSMEMNILKKEFVDSEKVTNIRTNVTQLIDALEKESPLYSPSSHYYSSSDDYSSTTFTKYQPPASHSKWNLSQLFHSLTHYNVDIFQHSKTRWIRKLPTLFNIQTCAASQWHSDVIFSLPEIRSGNKYFHQKESLESAVKSIFINRRGVTNQGK